MDKCLCVLRCFLGERLLIVFLFFIFYRIKMSCGIDGLCRNTECEMLFTTVTWFDSWGQGWLAQWQNRKLSLVSYMISSWMWIPLLLPDLTISWWSWELLWPRDWRIKSGQELFPLHKRLSYKAMKARYQEGGFQNFLTLPINVRNSVECFLPTPAEKRTWKHMFPCLFEWNDFKWGLDIAQWVEHLSSLHKALGLTPSITQNPTVFDGAYL